MVESEPVGALSGRLALYVMGPPRLELDGEPIRFARRKALTLLVYLAVTGETHRRDSLVNLLWPEYDSTRGQAALRRTLFALKKALDGAWLTIDRSQVGLDDFAYFWLDVTEFRQRLAESKNHGHSEGQLCAACCESLTAAVALSRGEFLSGFGLSDSANFDDWQRYQAEALRHELADTLDKLVQWHSSQREFELALCHARRRLALDPLDERTHRQLMRLYAWSGRRSDALSQYRECVAILEDQLDMPPQEATEQLFQDIKQGGTPSPPDKEEEPDQPAPRELLLDIQPPSFLHRDVPVERPVFVASERELALLDSHLDAALKGQGQVVFVTGAAGCGKTALIQEFAHRAQSAHTDLIVAGGHSNAQTGSGDPYLPFREVLSLLTGDVQAQWAAGAMTTEQAHRLWNTLPLTAQVLLETGPDLINTFVPGAPLVSRVQALNPDQVELLDRLQELAKQTTDTARGTTAPMQNDLFEQVTRVFQTLARLVPLVVVIDDLHWADLGTIGLLFHLSRQLRSSRILFLGAYRPEEIALGRLDPSTLSRQRERHPLEPVVNELQRSFGNITLNLEQTRSQDFVEALPNRESNRLGAAFQEMLYRQTGGHPLFTVELLRGIQDRGDLIQDDKGRWVEASDLDWDTLPARVEAVVAERIGRLAYPLQAALRIASVEGQEFTAEVVARVQAVIERELLAQFSCELDRQHRLIRAQSIQRIADQLLSRYRFRHILFQRYLYTTLDEVERVHLHDQIGTALEDLYAAHQESVDVTDIAVQLAWHFQEARNTEKAVHYLRQAGERAVQLSAYQEAIAHLNQGLALLKSLPDATSDNRQTMHLRHQERLEQELSLQLALGVASVGLEGNQSPRTHQAFTRARQLCQQTGKEAQLCRALAELSMYHFVRGEQVQALALSEQALGVAERVGDPMLMALAHWYLGCVRYSIGEYSKARSHLGQVIDFYDPAQHHRAFVLLRGSDGAVSSLGFDACCLWCLGYPDQARTRSQEALTLAQELDHPFSLADVLCFAGCAFSELSRDGQALKEHAEHIMRLASEKVPGWLGTGACWLGRGLVMLGEIEAGIGQLDEGIAELGSHNAGCHFTGTLLAAAKAQAAAGQLKQATETWTKAAALLEDTGERHWEAELWRLHAELLIVQGNEDEAETSPHKAIAIAQRQRAKSWELRATMTLARLWASQDQRGRARNVLSEVYDWFTEGFETPDLLEAHTLLQELD